MGQPNHQVVLYVHLEDFLDMQYKSVDHMVRCFKIKRPSEHSGSIEGCEHRDDKILE